MRSQILWAVSGLFVVGVIGTAQSGEITNAEDYDAAMKDVGVTFRALRSDREARNGEAVISGAEKLVALFEQVHAFWDTRDVPGAATTAMAARAAVAAIKAAVESRQFQEIGAADQALGAACQSCHSEYREQVDGGGYRIKPGVI